MPELHLRELSASILDLQVEMEDTGKRQYDIAAVGRDNQVDRHEQPLWNECMVKVEQLAGAAFSVLLAPTNKKCYLDCNQDSI